MENRYKVGDKVRIKQFEDLEGTISGSRAGEKRLSDGLWFLPSMAAMCGKIVTITNFPNPSLPYSRYSILGSDFSWSDECFVWQPRLEDILSDIKKEIGL